MTRITLAFILAVAASFADAQTYRKVSEADLNTLQGVNIGQPCESLKVLVESKPHEYQLWPGQRLSCKPGDYAAYDFTVGTQQILNVFLAPDKTVWMLLLSTRFDGPTKPRTDSVLQSWYDRFGRPLLEDDMANDPRVSEKFKRNSFGKALQRTVWSSKAPNPQRTTNVHAVLDCKSEAYDELNRCLAQAITKTNSGWARELANAPSTITTASANSEEGFVSYMTINMYLKEHQARAKAAGEIRDREDKVNLQRAQREQDKQLIPKF